MTKKKSKRGPEKNLLLLYLLTMPKSLTMWITATMDAFVGALFPSELEGKSDAVKSNIA